MYPKQQLIIDFWWKKYVTIKSIICLSRIEIINHNLLLYLIINIVNQKKYSQFFDCKILYQQTCDYNFNSFKKQTLINFHYYPIKSCFVPNETKVQFPIKCFPDL